MKKTILGMLSACMFACGSGYTVETNGSDPPGVFDPGSPITIPHSTTTNTIWPPSTGPIVISDAGVVGTSDSGSVSDDAATSPPTTYDASSVVDSGGPVCQFTPGAPSCTRTQGYWKNHAGDWSCTELPIALWPGGFYLYIDESQALTVLGLSTVSDAMVILASQLIAAELNNGFVVPDVADYITRAQVWMAANAFDPASLNWLSVDVNSPAGQRAVSIAAILDQFNNGKMSDPACQ